MIPLQTTPPLEKKRVLRRPPVLEDYINVTSTQGTRVFLVLRDDPCRTGLEVSRGLRVGFAPLWPPGGSGGAVLAVSLQLPDSLGWNARRPLHLLGVPFSYLKEQVYEEVPHVPHLPLHPCQSPNSCPPAMDWNLRAVPDLPLFVLKRRRQVLEASQQLTEIISR